jgi:mycofactocin precursor
MVLHPVPYVGDERHARTHIMEVPMSDRSDHQADSAAAELVEETLIEEVSIDGMCGVY